jgi:DNA polymerase III epsilon subunit-like protein
MILFFDTETTGLPKNYKAHYSNIDNWPRIVQLSWLMSDDAGNHLSESDNIIKPEGFLIPTGASNIHGITDEIANEQGKPLVDVLMAFQKDLATANLVCCHNLGYDKPILQAEFLRKDLNAEIPQSTFCTMLASTRYCNIPGNYGPKWPKLDELYHICFQKYVENAHNAMADVRATYECYFHLKAIGVF